MRFVIEPEPPQAQQPLASPQPVVISTASDSRKDHRLEQVHVITKETSRAPISGGLQPVIGQASYQTPGRLEHDHIANVTPARHLDDLDGVESLMPQFVRRRSATAAHQAVTDEVDAEMYESRTVEVSYLWELASLLKAEKEDSKDETMDKTL